MSCEKVTVIIPAYNCENTILLTLTALASQDYAGEIEVIVVDDGSTDSTEVKVVQGNKLRNVRYIRQGNAGPASARNRGAREAGGELLLFTDSDCVPKGDWISRLIPHFQDRQVGAVCGTYGIANPQSRLARCIQQEIEYRHDRLPLYPKVFGSYNLAIRRSVFESVRGFDTGYRHASGEDNDLSYKILAAGYKIRFERQAIVGHFHPIEWGRYGKEQYRHGFWRAKIYLDHPGMAAGDDYTFWKDAAEILLAGLVTATGLPALIFRNLSALHGALFALGLMAVIEFFFARKMIRSLPDRFYFAGTMMSRAFARAYGFFCGILSLLPRRILRFPAFF